MNTKYLKKKKKTLWILDGQKRLIKNDQKKGKIVEFIQKKLSQKDEPKIVLNLIQLPTEKIITKFYWLFLFINKLILKCYIINT